MKTSLLFAVLAVFAASAEAKKPKPKNLKEVIWGCLDCAIVPGGYCTCNEYSSLPRCQCTNPGPSASKRHQYRHGPRKIKKRVEWGCIDCGFTRQVCRCFESQPPKCRCVSPGPRDGKKQRRPQARTGDHCGLPDGAPCGNGGTCMAFFCIGGR